eukprot:7716931-Pyramimonas_sp.AAC.1
MQEVHADRVQLEQFVLQAHAHAVVHASFCAADQGGSGAGGVATILPRLALDGATSSCATPLIPGRVLQ